jgi:hypothetical protein
MVASGEGLTAPRGQCDQGSAEAKRSLERLSQPRNGTTPATVVARKIGKVLQ